MRTTHQDTFDLDMHEAIEAKVGQFPWLIGSIDASAKTEVNTFGKHHCDEDTYP